MSKPHGIKHANVKSGKMRSEGGEQGLTAQTRKILGKHYANKYRTGRG